jgi:hypothetical protein
VLRCKGVESDEAGQSLFRVLDGDEPAPAKSLSHVARIADLLLRENELAGHFREAGPGMLALELAADERTFFHNGIVFAALDAFNDPVKNPTLTMAAGKEEPPERGDG